MHGPPNSKKTGIIAATMAMARTDNNTGKNFCKFAGNNTAAAHEHGIAGLATASAGSGGQFTKM